MIPLQSSKKFALTLLLSTAGFSSLLATDHQESFDELTENFQDNRELLTKTRQQLLELDFALEELGQVVYSGAAKVTDKKAAREQILYLRELIERSLDHKTKSIGQTPVNVRSLVELDKALIARTNELVLKEFKETSEFNELDAVRHVRSSLPVNGEILQAELDSCQVQLDTLHSYIKDIGITSVNRVAKDIDTAGTQWHMFDAAKRALPYAAVGTYALYLLHEDTLKTLKMPWLDKLKAFIGSRPKKKQDTSGHIASNEAAKDAIKKDKAPDKPSTAPTESAKETAKPAESEPKVTIPAATKETAKPAESVPAQEVPKAEPKQPEAAAPKAEPTVKDLNDKFETLSKKMDNMAASFKSSTADAYENKGGIIGSIAFHLGNLIKFETETPLLTLSIASLFWPRVKEDLVNLGGWGSKQTRRTFAYLKGESFDDGSPAKEAKVIFPITGNEDAKKHLSKIATYFKEKEMIDRSGTLLGRGYVIVGPLDTARDLVHAVAKDVSDTFKAQNKRTVCKVYDVAAADLLTKDLKDILKDAEKVAPCVVLVHELDWLCKQDGVDATVWNKIKNAFSGLAKSKKDVFVVATAQERRSIDRVLESADRLGSVIVCEKPTLEDRELFIDKELHERCIKRSQFNTASIAQETEGCTYTQLRSLINRALNTAHTNREVVKPVHIEQSINELIHRIRTQEQIQNVTEKHILAAHYAGKALAHLLLAPQTKLLKATILPVDRKKGTFQGALISYEDPSFATYATEKDIEKLCIIELAGAQAQRILLNSVAPALSRPSKQVVITELNKIAFEGLTEKAFSKELRERKKITIEQHVEQLTEKAAALLEEHKDQLKLVAQQLEDKLVITASEMQELLG